MRDHTCHGDPHGDPSGARPAGDRVPSMRSLAEGPEDDQPGSAAERQGGSGRVTPLMAEEEDLKNLYVNPEFSSQQLLVMRLQDACTSFKLRRLRALLFNTSPSIWQKHHRGSGWQKDLLAEIAVTASLAMIFGPALPLLNVLAAVSCFTRYLVDWYVFLRHSRRPPMYDETIARVCVDQLLWGLVLRSATSILVWVDPILFMSDVAGCSVSESDDNALREKYFMENFRMIEMFFNPTCNPTAWFFGFLPGLSAVGCLLVLPNLTILRSLFLVLCRRCRSKTGYLYDEVVQARMQRRLVPSYQPRVHPAYQSAFKLMDLTANFNEQGLSDSSESHASTDLASEEGEEHEDNALAATIFGKDYASMDHFKREKAERKARKKEKKEKSGEEGDKKHKKRRKSKSTDPFMDDEVNPYDAGASDKHKKKKKEKGSKKDQAQFSEAKELAGLVDF
ncbi:mug158 [Symbiodinium natans]|uniref:Mug158 protein n=1 Tax=Symbiodinium natans TaxID=878477 RepID=A0A812TPU0_9DINO|nr:mug158 [Symbiodinium natans]